MLAFLNDVLLFPGCLGLPQRFQRSVVTGFAKAFREEASAPSEQKENEASQQSIDECHAYEGEAALAEP